MCSFLNMAWLLDSLGRRGKPQASSVWWCISQRAKRENRATFSYTRLLDDVCVWTCVVVAVAVAFADACAPTRPHAAIPTLPIPIR